MSKVDPESPVLKTPEWLEVLENKRKRPHKLAHEIGAGAPCLVCKDGCKGLNLHFWRKLCIECKCRKEDHEVQEEEDYAQFEILLGAKKVKRTTLKFNAQNKSFDWIPPNIEPDLAVDYLKSIPLSKLPISNSEGARYRKQQLEKQVPLHDVDPNACSNLSDKEIKEFHKYLDNLRDNVIGQGKILKYQPAELLKENYIHGTSPNMLATSEEYGDCKPQGAQILGQLTIDKMQKYNAFSQSLQNESYPADIKIFKHQQPTNSELINSQALKTQPLKKLGSEKPLPQHSSTKHDLSFSPKKFNPSTHTQRQDDLKTNLSSETGFQGNLSLRTPSSFINKNLPIHDRQNNNAQPDNNCNSFLPEIGLKGQSEPFYSKDSDDKVGGIDWNQENINFLQDPYNAAICKDSLPDFKELNISSSKVPFIPVQESSNFHKPHGNVLDITQLKSDPNVQIETSNSFPSPPATCQQCLEILFPEEVVVQAERGGDSALWHAKCFICETCKELLVDLMYFFHKGKVYCGRHYAEIMKIPRCYGCDELIFVKEYTIAEDQSYHVHHFCCFHCDEPLGGKQYIPKDSFPVCLDCYQVKYGKNCRTCRFPIAAGEQRVSWKDLNFHVSPECFRCSQCKKSLLGGKFVARNSDVFCSKECVQQFPG